MKEPTAQQAAHDAATQRQDPPLGSDGVRRRDLMLTALKAAPVIVLLTARGARAQESGGSGTSGGE